MLQENAAAAIEPDAMHKFSYGLFLLSTRDGEKDNACIINTAIQITDNPKRVLIAVNQANFSNELIKKTGVFNLSVLTEGTPFSIFQAFGFRSGRDTDKFAGLTMPRTENGLINFPGCANAVLSCKVLKADDCGTHTIFLAEVVAAQTLSKEPSATYAYYFSNIKPKPQPKAAAEKKIGWVCKICGYVYEGEELPADFICPVCKHGAEDFERL